MLTPDIGLPAVYVRSVHHVIPPFAARRPRHTGRSFSEHAAVIAWHQHCQRRAAGARHCVPCLVPGGAVGVALLFAGRHHLHYRHRPFGRQPQSPPPAAGGHRAVYRRFADLHAGSATVAVAGGAPGAGAGGSGHDVNRHGAGGRGSGDGKNRPRDGAARHDVGRGHRAGAVVGRCADRRFRLAGDVPDQPAIGPAGAVACLAILAEWAARGNACGTVRSRRHVAAGRRIALLFAGDDPRARRLRRA